ncbi:hypothetical protein GCM10010187_02780 [Actinomadura coerulea]|nr:hypothetical protein GCM10010187_02780 [Actinomadura coerulea]
MEGRQARRRRKSKRKKTQAPLNNPPTVQRRPSHRSRDPTPPVRDPATHDPACVAGSPDLLLWEGSRPGAARPSSGGVTCGATENIRGGPPPVDSWTAPLSMNGV